MTVIYCTYTYVCSNICIVQLPQPVTQGDITGYQVYYNGTMRNVNSSTTTLTFTAPSLPDGVFSDTIVVMVTGFNQFGTGLPSDPATAGINGTYVSMYVRRYTYIQYIHIHTYVPTVVYLCTYSTYVRIHTYNALKLI